MKKVIIAIIVVVLISSGTYFLLHKHASKTYSNTEYNYQFSFPSSFTDYHRNPLSSKGTVFIKTNGQGSDDFVIISESDLSIPYITDWGSNISVDRQNGEYFIKDSKSVDDFWNRLAKNDEKGDLVNKYTGEKTIDGVKFILFDQKNSDGWFPQALFFYQGNFFWVGDDKVDAKTYRNVLSTFKFSK